MTTALPTSRPQSIKPSTDVANLARGHDLGEVFAAGSTLRRRWLWVGAGALLLTFAALDWAGGLLFPAIGPITAPAALVFAGLGVAAIMLGVLRRTRGFQITRQGVVTITGGRVFGERHLYPWSSLQRLGGRRAGDDAVKVFYIQQHVTRHCPLKGSRMTVQAYDHLIDRLRVVLGDRYKNLKLGGLEG